MPRSNNELRYWEALARIKRYMRPEQLRRNAEKMYGLPYAEALEYAYENVIGEAEAATRGKRRPKPATQL